MVCKGICHRYRTKWTTQKECYANGQKRCNVCEIFVSWDGFFCPCCGYRLRSKPRNGKYKEKYYEAIRKNERVIAGRL